jgi:hypothetical protein
MRYAILDQSSICVNLILCDDISAWPLPTGFVAVEDTGFCIGATYAFNEGAWVLVQGLPGPSEEQLAQEVRQQRNELLAESDWTQLPDSPADHEAWAAYRQALRDVTSQEGFPWDITWPEAP